MATNYQLPILETIKSAWQLTKGHKASIWGGYAWLTTLIFICAVGANVIRTYQLESFYSLADCLQWLIYLLSSISLFGLLRLGIRVAKGDPISATMIFYPLRKPLLLIKLFGFWLLSALVLAPFIFATAVLIAMVYHGPEISFQVPTYILFFSILPICLAFILMIRLQCGWALILDKEVNPWEALKLSFALTKGNFWPLTGIFFANACISALSILPLGLGLIWSLPYGLCAYGVIYRKLLEGQKVN